MDRHVLLRLLLSIVLLLSFVACIHPARLQGKSPLIIPSGQPHSPSVSQIINMTFEQLPPSSPSISLSLSQTTNLTQLPPSSTPLQLTVSVVYPSNSTPPTLPSLSVSNNNSKPSPAPPPLSAFAPANDNPKFSPAPPPPSAFAPASASSNTPSAFAPASASSNQSINSTVAQPPHPSSPFAGVSRGGLNLLGKIGIAIAVIVVSLVILIAVLKAFKKASHNDLGAGSVDIRRHTTGQRFREGIQESVHNDLEKAFKRAYTTRQVANPGGNILEVGIKDIRTHTVEELNSLEEGIGIRTYKMEELANATNNFTTKVGQGVSGFVYRANLPGDRMGAVKRATDLDPNLFKQELSVLLRLNRHPHLVDLIGLCLEPGEQILVFEFISNGNLHDRLHQNKGVSSPLSWEARMDIAYQVAVALQYLHEEAKPPILHRDVKSANVLLVDDHCAKLADFGLSKLGPKNNQFTNTLIRGTYGYMDPQYIKTHRFSAKSDVYSFGVLLLELMTGLKSLHEGTPLAEWTQTYRLSEDIDMFMTIVDRNMMGHINTMEVQNMIKVANLCLRDLSEERSSMREIVNMMQETRNLKANGNLSDGGEAPLLGAEAEAPGAEAEAEI